MNIIVLFIGVTASCAKRNSTFFKFLNITETNIVGVWVVIGYVFGLFSLFGLFDISLLASTRTLQERPTLTRVFGAAHPRVRPRMKTFSTNTSTHPLGNRRNTFAPRKVAVGDALVHGLALHFISKEAAVP